MWRLAAETADTPLIPLTYSVCGKSSSPRGDMFVNFVGKPPEVLQQNHESNGREEVLLLRRPSVVSALCQCCQRPFGRIQMAAETADTALKSLAYSVCGKSSSPSGDML